MNDRRYLLFEPTEFAYSEQKVAYRGQHYQRTVADLTCAGTRLACGPSLRPVAGCLAASVGRAVR